MTPTRYEHEYEDMREERDALAERIRSLEADAARWRMLMHLGTCYYDTSPERPAPICEGSKRVYFHECDQEGEVTLTEYIDAAIAEEGRKHD